MKIYDGGSEKDSLLNVFTGNTLPPTTLTTGNQMLLTYTKNTNGVSGKGFSASLEFGKTVTFF